MSVKKDNEIVIVYATNDKYAPYLGVSIYSLIQNVSKNNRYKIYVLQKGLNEHHRVRIKNLAVENVVIELLDVSELMRGKKIPTIAYLSEEATYRLLVDKLLGMYNKILYLDCDTVINKDVAELYNVDIEGYILGVSLDNLEESLAKKIFEVVDVPKERYFNSGVMLINIPLFRQNNIGDKCFELLQSGITYPTLDQDVLNITCQESTKIFDGRWNAEWQCVIAGGLKYLREKQKEDIKDPFIIHYVSQKPWAFPGFQQAEHFWKYARKTVFYEEILLLNIKNTTVEVNPFQRYVFPWNKINPSENVIIYGAGVVGRTFFKQISMSQYCCIKAFCDKNYSKITDLNVPVISIDNINKFEYDKIVVAIEKETIAKEVIEELGKNGIDKCKVIWCDYKRK